MQSWWRVNMLVPVSLDIVEFPVPDKVSVRGSLDLKSMGFTDNRTVHLSELDTDTLEVLCKQFRQDVFAKAGKPRRGE
jgi:hypothetical protein